MPRSSMDGLPDQLKTLMATNLILMGYQISRSLHTAGGNKPAFLERLGEFEQQLRQFHRLIHEFLAHATHQHPDGQAAPPSEDYNDDGETAEEEKPSLAAQSETLLSMDLIELGLDTMAAANRNPEIMKWLFQFEPELRKFHELIHEILVQASRHQPGAQAAAAPDDNDDEEPQVEEAEWNDEQNEETKSEDHNEKATSNSIIRKKRKITAKTAYTGANPNQARVVTPAIRRGVGRRGHSKPDSASQMSQRQSSRTRMRRSPRADSLGPLRHGSSSSENEEEQEDAKMPARSRGNGGVVKSRASKDGSQSNGKDEESEQEEEFIFQTGRKPRALANGYDGLLENSFLQYSVGRTRHALNKHLRRVGLTAKFGQSIVSGSLDEFSHLTFNSTWNDVPQTDNETLEIWLGTGSKRKGWVRPFTSRRENDPIPIFWSCKNGSGAQLCHYIGHWYCMGYQQQSCVHKSIERQGMFGFRFHHFDYRLANVIESIAE